MASTKVKILLSRLILNSLKDFPFDLEKSVPENVYNFVVDTTDEKKQSIERRLSEFRGKLDFDTHKRCNATELLICKALLKYNLVTHLRANLLDDYRITDSRVLDIGTSELFEYISDQIRNTLQTLLDDTFVPSRNYYSLRKELEIAYKNSWYYDEDDWKEYVANKNANK